MNEIIELWTTGTVILIGLIGLAAGFLFGTFTNQYLRNLTRREENLKREE
ncbi:unnamed protein product, partial [marine sediment metagenome]